MVVASDFDEAKVLEALKVTILTEAEVVAVSTHEAGSDDGVHETQDTVVVIMSSESIREQR